MIKHANKKKNESFDLSSDIHDWLNDYCVNLMNSGATIEDIKVELSNLDYTELADDVMLDLSLDEDDRDLVEYDLERFASDFLDYIETGRKDSHFDKNLSDWLDKYKNNAEYSASLESRVHRLEKLMSLKCEKLSAKSLRKLLNLVDGYITDEVCDEGRYNSDDEFVAKLSKCASGKAEDIVREVFSFLVDECGYAAEDVRSNIGAIREQIKESSKNNLDFYNEYN